MEMRKKIAVLLAFLVACGLALSVGAASIGYYHGDANADGTVNLKDVTALRRMLAAGDVDLSKIEGNPDVNGDSVVNMKDITLLRRYLAGGWGVELPQTTEPESENPLPLDLAHYELLQTTTSSSGVVSTAFRFGTSVLGRDLVCWSIHQGTYSRTVLLNFAIHGWEDEYAADGQVLVELGNTLVDYYANSENLRDCRLLIISCANPDGIMDGNTQDGFGRCNADGIDLNRDFDANHMVYTNPRNYTPEPFSGAESRALRDLVWAAKPDIVVDFHGWLNYTIGSSALAEVFSLHVGVNHKKELTSAAHGYFSYWAQLQGAEAILVEFKNPDNVIHGNVIQAVDRLVADNYGYKQADYALKPEFADFSGVEAFALTSGRIYTQGSVGNTGTSYGYIDGSADLCKILQIYDNGWCKVNYPVGDLTKTGYCEISAFMDTAVAVEPYAAKLGETVSVYRTSAMTETIGTVQESKTVTVTAEKNELIQVICPQESGGYILGWIKANSVLRNE